MAAKHALGGLGRSLDRSIATVRRLHDLLEPTRTQPCLMNGAWLSLVERLLWEQDVGGSNPLAPTNCGLLTKALYLR